MIIVEVANALGMNPSTLIASAVALSVVARAVGAVIPDNATGIAGGIRNLAKVIGLSISNRVERGVSVTDVARASLTIANVARVARQSER
jgi:hypothetical protein